MKTRTQFLSKVRKTSFLVLTVFLGFVFSSFYYAGTKGNDWKVPENAKKVNNPIKSSGEVIAAGKSLYNKHCRSCHGKNGEGDGPKSGELKTPSGDFTEASFKAQTDGELYYKIVEGRDDMPSYKKKIPDSEDIWSMVHYIKTFKK
jgi:mono/diheme cytochrome c family protein